MQVQLNTDDDVQGRASLAAWAERELNDKLARFREGIARIEVHLSDASAPRIGAYDKRCVIEARLARRRPIAVSHDAGKVADAFHGATDKLVRALDTALRRARSARRRRSIRGVAPEQAGQAAQAQRTRTGLDARVGGIGFDACSRV
jgi:hypothetical protein